MRTSILLLPLLAAAPVFSAEPPIIAALPSLEAGTPTGEIAEDSLGDYTAALEAASTPPPRGESITASVMAPPPPVTPGGATPFISGGGAPPIVPPPASPPPVAAAPASLPVPAAVELVSPAPASQEPIDDSLEAATAATEATIAPAPAEAGHARGLALLPSRPEAAELRFSDVTAAEVVLRFAREYRVSVVLSGDGSTRITGWAKQTGNIEEMLRAVFPAPEWTVARQGGTYLVTARTSLSFRRISLSELNPGLEPAK